jgi:hypothetical protein
VRSVLWAPSPAALEGLTFARGRCVILAGAASNYYVEG